MIKKPTANRTKTIEKPTVNRRFCSEASLPPKGCRFESRQVDKIDLRHLPKPCGRTQGLIFRRRNRGIDLRHLPKPCGRTGEQIDKKGAP